MFYRLLKLLMIIGVVFIPLVGRNLSYDGGWQMIGVGGYSCDINPKKLLSDNPDVEYIWTFKGGKWYVDSNHYISHDKYLSTSKINNNEGFWIKAKKSGTLKINISNANVINNKTIDIKSGWNMYGFDSTISSLTFDNPNIKIVWAYDNSIKKWEAYSFDNKTRELIQKIGLKTIDTIPENRGFWINSDTNLSLSIIRSDINNAIFISPDGNDDNNGSYNFPLKDTKKLCSKGTVLDKNIYLRGGIYDNFPMIQCSGSEDKILEIKPWLNEKVKFTFDGAVGVRLNGNYVKFSGVEVEGVARKIAYKDALANWWRGDKKYNGSGIVLSGHHIEVADCIVHDATGSGISAKGWSNINIHNNIVYDCDWWTIAGSKGIGVTDANEVGNEDNKTTIKIENNLIFGVESRIFSRVWSKGFAHLTLDEGEGILVQVNDGNYTGRYSIKNNFLLYTGKGIVVNKTDRADVTNNTLYQTGTTIAGNFKGIRASLTKDSIFEQNAVMIKGIGFSFSLGKSDVNNVTLTNNCGNGKESLSGVNIKDNIFIDPAHLDFTPQNGCKGASTKIWDTLKKKADENSIEIKPTDWTPDYVDLTKGVIEHIPDGSKVDWSSWNDTKPFDLNITNIPNEGVKGRPNKFRLEVVFPYHRK